MNERKWCKELLPKRSRGGLDVSKATLDALDADALVYIHRAPYPL